MDMISQAGLRFSETLTGTWTRTGATSAEPATIAMKAIIEDTFNRLRDGRAAIEGRATFQGFATDKPFVGHMIFSPVTRGHIRYEFDFAGNDHKRYHLSGQKNVRIDDLLNSMLELSAVIQDDSDAEIGTCVVRFDPKSDLLNMVAGIRPSFGT